MLLLMQIVHYTFYITLKLKNLKSSRVELLDNYNLNKTI